MAKGSRDKNRNSRKNCIRTLNGHHVNKREVTHGPKLLYFDLRGRHVRALSSPCIFSRDFCGHFAAGGGAERAEEIH